MDVRLPDGTVIQNVPDGTTKDQLRAKLSAAGHDIHKMGLGPTADDIPLAPGAKERMAAQAALPKAPEDNLLGKVVGGVIETPLAIGTGMLGGAAGAIAGVGKAALKKLTTGQGSSDKEVNDTTAAVSNALTYQPRTQTGNALVRGAGEALESSGVAGIPIPELNALGRGMATSSQALRGLAAPSAAAMAAQDAAQAAGGGSLRNLLARPQPTMAGVGAADTGEATIRAQRFANYPVPLKPTRGMIERTREQARFERETAKTKEGDAINDRYADVNEGFVQGLDHFADETGAQATSINNTGKAYVSAVSAKKAAAKAGVNAMYKEAEQAGEMQHPVDVSALVDFIAKNKGKDKLAPIISTIEAELKQNAKVEGGGYNRLTLTPQPERTIMTLGASEDLRQAINKLSEPGTPNVVYGIEAKKLIDAATEGKGGAKYQQARRAYENYANEFENRDIIDRVLRMKPGSNDRAVAFEDVFKNTILKGSTDEVRHVFRVLEAHPANADPAIIEAGQQAARELRGATIRHLKEELLSNGGADTKGNVVGSQFKFKNAVEELDTDGRLDVIFGKKGAQTIRDAKDMAVDIYTAPPGTVNASNNAPQIVAAVEKLNKLAGITSEVPLLRSATRYMAQKAESNALSKKVKDTLNPPQMNALARRPTQP